MFSMKEVDTMVATQILAKVENSRLQKAVEGLVGGAYEVTVTRREDGYVAGYVKNGSEYHDLVGFTRNQETLVENQAGINASTTWSHEYPPAKRRLANESKEENTSRVMAWQRCPKVFSPLANANCSDVDATVGARWRSDCARQLKRKWRLTASSLRT